MTEKQQRRSGDSTLGRLMKVIREENGFTQKQIAEKTGSKEETIRRYEQGRTSPSAVWLREWELAVDANDAQQQRLDLWRRGNEDLLNSLERLFLEELAKPSLVVGGTNINTKLVPTFLWDEPRSDHLYIDDPEELLREGGRPIRLDWTDAALPETLLAELMQDMRDVRAEYEKETSQLSYVQYRNICDVYDRIAEQRSNPYPRPVALPDIVASGNARMLRIGIAQSKYGINHIAEKKIALPRAINLRGRHVLSSLALRVAYVFRTQDGQDWMECHQRTAGSNATWPLAWDTGAGGYFDPLRHTDPDDPLRISPWMGCVDELTKELNIPDFELPHRDHFYFFGLAHDMPTGTVILCGYCHATYVPDSNRPTTELVRAYDRCLLNPEAVADFILAKHKWVPSALLTSILTLEAFGFERERIERAFSRLAGQIDLSVD